MTLPLLGKTITKPVAALSPFRGKGSPFGYQEVDVQIVGVSNAGLGIPVEAFPGIRPVGGATEPAPVSNNVTPWFQVMRRSEVYNQTRSNNRTFRTGPSAGLQTITDAFDPATLPTDSDYVTGSLNGQKFQCDDQNYGPTGFSYSRSWFSNQPQASFYDHTTRTWFKDWFVIRVFNGHVDDGSGIRSTFRYEPLTPHLVNYGPPVRVAYDPSTQLFEPANGYFPGALGANRLGNEFTMPFGYGFGPNNIGYERSSSTQLFSTGWIHQADLSKVAIHQFILQMPSSSPIFSSTLVDPSTVAVGRTGVYWSPTGGFTAGLILHKYTPVTSTYQFLPIRDEVSGDVLTCEVKNASGSAIETFTVRRLTEEDVEANQDIFGPVFHTTSTRWYEPTGAFGGTLTCHFDTSERGYEAWIGISPSGATVIVWAMNSASTWTSPFGEWKSNVAGNRNYGVYWAKPDADRDNFRSSRMSFYLTTGLYSGYTTGSTPFTSVSVNPLKIRLPVLGLLDNIIGTNPSIGNRAITTVDSLSLDITEGGSGSAPPAIMADTEVQIQFYLQSTLGLRVFTARDFKPNGSASGGAITKVMIDGNEKNLFIGSQGMRIRGLSYGWHELILTLNPGSRLRYKWSFDRGEPGDNSGPDWIERNRIVFFMNPNWRNLVLVEILGSTLTPSFSFDSTQETFDSTTQWTWDRG